MSTVASQPSRVSLDVITVATPCPASWQGMSGNERVRFCSQCQQKVYNVSEMSKPEAEAFLTENIGSVCIRLFRRQDGTILTRDCPVGIRAIRRNMASALTAFVGMASVLVALFYWRPDRETNAPSSNLHNFVSLTMDNESDESSDFESLDTPVDDDACSLDIQVIKGPLGRLVDWLDPPGRWFGGFGCIMNRVSPPSKGL